MQMKDESLMSIVERAMEERNLNSEHLGCELDLFFNNVMDTVVEYFEVEKV